MADMMMNTIGDTQIATKPIHNKTANPAVKYATILIPPIFCLTYTIWQRIQKVIYNIWRIQQ